MVDEVAIQQTINAYTEGCGRGDWPQIMATFTPDAVWETTSPVYRAEGHKAIEEMLRNITGMFQYFVQINAPAVIEIDGNRATARSPIREAGRLKDSDQLLEVFGTYDDRLIRTAEGWRFSRRTYRTIGMFRLPILPEAG